MQHVLAIIDKPFVPGWNTPGLGLRPFAAELWLIGTIIAVLLTPFFTPRRSNAACGGMTLIGLSLALVALLITGTDVTGPQLRGLLVIDHAAVIWKTLLLVFAIGVVLMWFATTSEAMHEGDGPEFFTLLLGATLGMSVMASTTNLLMIFMGIELASLPSYVLAGFRKTNRVGAEASLKYVLFAAATSSFMVYGLSLLYGLYGTLQFEQLVARMAHADGGGTALLAVAVFGLIVGVGSKICAVPFHLWCPDVFEGAGVDVSAFLSVASKGAAIVLLMRLLTLLASATGYHDVPGVSLTKLAVVVGLLGTITVTVGNLGAFVQTNIKRLLAYSSIAHAGYMLCALSLFAQRNVAGPKLVDSMAQATLLYLAVYVFMNLGAFTVAGLVSRQTGGETLAGFVGLGRRSPLLAASMFCCLVSLIGLPPFAGFLAKLNVMYVLGANGGWWWALVAVVGINTIFSLYYYLRIAKVMYFESSGAPAFLSDLLGLGLSVGCAAVLILMFLAASPLQNWTAEYGRIHVEPPASAGGFVTPVDRTARVD